jgi:hypothetical protein
MNSCHWVRDEQEHFVREIVQQSVDANGPSTLHGEAQANDPKRRSR